MLYNQRKRIFLHKAGRNHVSGPGWKPWEDPQGKEGSEEHLVWDRPGGLSEHVEGTFCDGEWSDRSLALVLFTPRS